MPVPQGQDNGFTVDLSGKAPQGDERDASQAALIKCIREELISVPTRVSDGVMSTPQIDDNGTITSEGEVDPIVLQTAIERAVGKYIDAVNHNISRVYGS